MDDLEQLEKLSLVSKISSELSNHIGIQDKVLAEFILHLHSEAEGSLDTFKASLGQVGADFPDSFVASLDRLIRTLKPNQGHEKSKTKKQQEPAQFPGLAIPDDSDRIKKLEQEVFIEQEASSARVPRSLYDSSDDEARRHSSSSRSRKRSRSPPSPGVPSRRRFNDDDDDEYEQRRQERRSKAMKWDDSPILSKVYRGKVMNIKDFGAFVALEGIKVKVEGLVHISAFSSSRVGHPSDVVSRGDQVYVKVISIEGNRIGLSMKEVDQRTGRDISGNPYAPDSNENQSEDNLYRNPERPLLSTEKNLSLLNSLNTKKTARKRLSSPERFEIKQLIAAGVLKVEDYPDLDEQHGVNVQPEMEEEVDIEIKEEEPLFLKGQTKTAVELSPIRIVKNPEGSLNRAAMNGAVLARERRELRQQKSAEAEKKGTPGDGDASAYTERQSAFSRPDPRKKSEPISYGKITDLSIKDQRESLPIYKLRQTIIKAVDENQVLILVGDTGSGKVSKFS